MTPGPGISRTPLPRGFLAAGINSGVRRYRPDLGILISETDAVCAGIFTTNQCKAAPVLYSMGILPSAHARAIITNSGQANAATGEPGRQRNWELAVATARSVGCAPHQVVTASTGVIGAPLEIDKLVQAIPRLVERGGFSAEGFAVAILTTDLVPKTVHAEVELSGGKVAITGICKGSGMIHPNMATMLAYVLTDAALSLPLAQELLRDAADHSFNMVSVDGDMSTNDCSFLMANGASGVAVRSPSDIVTFQQALRKLCITLAQAIARDGEGATKLIEVKVSGAPTLDLARKAARGITLSPLVKSAIHGSDPNWGRILARFGSEGIPAEALHRLTLRLQDIPVFENGTPSEFGKPEARQALRTDFVRIAADFGFGDSEATAWGCDLSSKYVEINTEYS